VKHNIFALELLLRLEPNATLRERLRDLVARHPAASSAGAKWKLLRRVAELLLDNEQLFEKGCWDFFDDDDRALKDYHMWSYGMISEEGARKVPSGAPDAKAGEPRYMTFTISLLLKADTPCARELGALCDIPDKDLWKKTTFVRILKGLSKVSFSAVKSDVLYLIPGEPDWGLTEADLKAEKFEYLRQIA
jgi:hypothetical protein